MSGFVFPPESVYNLLPREETVAQKPPRYMSKFRPTVLRENKSTKDSRRTMGPAEVDLPSPEKFLKKRSREFKPPERAECEKESRSRSVRKPPVPPRTDQPLMGLQTQREIVRTSEAAPVRPRPTCVDTCRGHKQPLENSGLRPHYVHKKDYGEVPEYLLQRNEEEKLDQEEFRKFVKEQKEQGAMKQLSEEERRNILEGLKKNWDLLHHQYQSLSFVTDTVIKKSQKKRLEVKMEQLENDIRLIERFRNIYIPKKQDDQ